MVTGEPPDGLTFFSLLSATNPIHRPSGDQKAPPLAPWVPESGWTSIESIGRIQSWERPLAEFPKRTKYRPSGEGAGKFSMPVLRPASSPALNERVNWVAIAGSGAVACGSHFHAEAKPAAATANAATIHRQWCGFWVSSGAGRRLAHFNSASTSFADAHRSSGS